jgi:tetratricopeptide (TPR) repeat protein
VLEINKMTKMIKLIVVFCLCVMSINSALAQSSVKPSITEANAEFVYKYLLGEIAGQRGDLSLASQLFLDLAKKTRDPRLAERAAKTAAYGRHQRLALDSATLWAELDPSSLEAQQATSQMMISTGDIQSAVPHIKELLNKEESRATTFLYLNDLLRNQQDKKAVLTTIKGLAQPYPVSAEAHFAVAQAAWFAQDMDAAESAIKQASQLRPDWEVSAQMQGHILAKKSPEKAVDFYKAFLNKNPKANNLRMHYAKLLVRLKRYEEAKPEFTKLTELEKDNPDTNAVVGLLSLEANELDMAEQYLQQSLRNDFKDPEKIYMYLGIIADRKKNKSKALEWYGKIHKSNQHYLEAQLATANIIAQTKNTDAAISMLDNLTELTVAQEVVVAQAKASLLVQDKRHQEAFELIKKTINTIPNTPQLIYDYAMAAERIGKLDLMENELRKVIQLKSDFSAAYNALGYSFADRNINLKEAKALIETAHKLSPSDHYILDSLGWVEYRLGNYALAVEHLRKAYSVQEDPEISAHLGEVLWKQGLQEEAKNIWGKALKAFPENSTLVSTSKKFNS